MSKNVASSRAARWVSIAALAVGGVGITAGVAVAAGSFHEAKKENWGLVDRNTIGSPVAALRDGPSAKVIEAGGQLTTPPFGKGSLGIEVGSGNDKVSFGDQVDFFGDNVLDLNQVGFYVFRTGEDGSLQNLPNITLEIDANLNALPADNYTSMVWVPNGSALPVNMWSDYVDATTNGYWYFTGAEAGATGCTQAGTCNFTQAMAALNDGGDAPVDYTVQIAKGRDSAFQGAVDGLRINDKIYDFESDGVKAKGAPK